MAASKDSSGSKDPGASGKTNVPEDPGTSSEGNGSKDPGASGEVSGSKHPGELPEGNGSDESSGSNSSPKFLAGDRPVIFTDNPDTAYAGMLIFLVKEYLPRIKTLRQLNRIVEIGTLAWNLALTLKIDPDNFEAVRDDHVFNLDIDDDQLAVIEQMIEVKNGLFLDFHQFIIASLVTNGPDNSYEVMVKTGEYDDFDFVPDEEE